MRERDKIKWDDLIEGETDLREGETDLRDGEYKRK